jgi:hypothetical protein
MTSLISRFLNYQFGSHQQDWVGLGIVFAVLLLLWVPSAVRLALIMRKGGR